VTSVKLITAVYPSVTKLQFIVMSVQPLRMQPLWHERSATVRANHWKFHKLIRALCS